MEHSASVMHRTTTTGVTLMKEEEAFPQWIGLACLTVAAILCWVIPNTGSADPDLGGEEDFLGEAGQLLLLTMVLLIIMIPAGLYVRVGRSKPGQEQTAEENGSKTNNQAARSASAPAAATAETLPSLSPSPGAWSPKTARAKSPRDQALGKIRSTLNKLTEENFDKLFEQLVEACLAPASDDELLNCLVKEVFEKATQQHTHREDHFIGLYTKLCLRLHDRLGATWSPDDQQQSTTEPKRAAFKRILREQCQQTFDRYQEVPVFAEDLCEEEVEEEQLKHKIRRLGNMKFAGHLISHELLPGAEVVPRFAAVLLQDESGAEDLEALCALLTVAGPFFDKELRAGSKEFEALMSALTKRVAKEGAKKDSSALPRRVLCLVQDLMDLRCRSWQARSGAAKANPTAEEENEAKSLNLDPQQAQASHLPRRRTCRRGLRDVAFRRRAART